MKTIIVRWVPEKESMYGTAMQVIESDHPRFTNVQDLFKAVEQLKNQFKGDLMLMK